MSEIDKIKKRISKRKEKENLYQQAISLDNRQTGSKIFKGLMIVMTIYALFMSFAIYARHDENATALNSIFNTNFNFKSFNKGLNQLLNPRIMDKVEGNNEELVSGEIKYLSEGNDYYTSEGNLVVALDDGVITYVNGKDEDYTVIVEYDCGVRATYTQISEVNVFVNDRIYSDDILGSYQEKMKILFVKNNHKISYEEVISIL